MGLVLQLSPLVKAIGLSLSRIKGTEFKLVPPSSFGASRFSNIISFMNLLYQYFGCLLTRKRYTLAGLLSPAYALHLGALTVRALHNLTELF